MQWRRYLPDTPASRFFLLLGFKLGVKIAKLLGYWSSENRFGPGVPWEPMDALFLLSPIPETVYSYSRLTGWSWNRFMRMISIRSFVVCGP